MEQHSGEHLVFRTNSHCANQFGDPEALLAAINCVIAKVHLRFYFHCGRRIFVQFTRPAEQRQQGPG
jgi:hypothetical protein